MQDSNLCGLEHFSKHFCALTYSNSTNTLRKLRAVPTASPAIRRIYLKSTRKFCCKLFSESSVFILSFAFCCCLFTHPKVCASRGGTQSRNTLYIPDLASRSSPSERNIKMNPGYSLLAASTATICPLRFPFLFPVCGSCVSTKP